MKQEVRIQLDVSVTIDAEHSRVTLLEMIQSAARTFMLNNHKVYHCLRFAEEADIYPASGTYNINWETVLAPDDELSRRAFK